MSISYKQFAIRKAVAEDLPEILKFRAILFKEMEIPSEALVSNSKELLFERYVKEFEQGNLQHYLAFSADGKLVASAGALLKDDFPYHLFNPGYYGWIVDVYTVPEFRGNGISSLLLELTNEWLVSKGAVEAKLIASGSDARRLYERIGFRQTLDMHLPLTSTGTYNSYLAAREERRG